MDRLMQLIYISRATFRQHTASGGIEPNVARILAKARTNNLKHGLGGVLYFGDGCFFQCLEGKKGTIEALYNKLTADTRHSDLKVISFKEIPQTSFTEWTMKYIPIEKKVQDLLRQEGLRSFNPYKFSEAGTKTMLSLLHEAGDVDDQTVSTIAEEYTLAEIKRKESFLYKASRGKNWVVNIISLVLIAVCVMGIKNLIL